MFEPIRADVQEAQEQRVCKGALQKGSKDTEADLERNGTELSAVLGQIFWGVLERCVDELLKRVLGRRAHPQLHHNCI